MRKFFTCLKVSGIVVISPFKYRFRRLIFNNVLGNSSSRIDINEMKVQWFSRKTENVWSSLPIFKEYNCTAVQLYILQLASE